MAGTEEPTQKKSRRTRTIELDLSLFPDWVGKADDNTLLEVFAIGVKVRDSIAIRITENPKYITNILGEKLQPVYDKVDNVSKRFVTVQNNVATSLTAMQSDVSKLQNRLLNDIDEVAKKVPSLDSVLQPIKSCEDKLDKLVEKYQKPAVKGALGEQEVRTILQDRFPTYTILHNRDGRKADIQIKSAQSGHQYLVEVKDHKKEIAAPEIEKFKKDVQGNKDFKVGILFSLRSGISVLANQGRFTIKFEDDQYYIYVPNALNEQENLIVWIVILADQLAVLNQGLTDRQTEELNKLLNEFQQSVDTSTTCKNHLTTLKQTVKALEDAMVPMLKIMINAKAKLNKALHKDHKDKVNKDMVSILE